MSQIDARAHYRTRVQINISYTDILEILFYLFGFSRMMANYPADEQEQCHRIRTGLLPGKRGYVDATCAATFDISKGRVEVSFPPSEGRHTPGVTQHPAEMCTTHKRSTY